MTAKHAFHPESITDANGHHKVVVLPIEKYGSLIEDLADLAIVAERPGEPTLSREAVMDELERDGLRPD
ncbi:MULTISPECIES: hypothetical protein [unclassified Thiocapsa]|uniref:hypothetical protein n=1 Tax=unclassified Thiocapsa TaxID=2641286 RepID=UPI0035AF34D7